MTEFRQNRVSKAIWPWPEARKPAKGPESCRPRAIIQFVVMMVVAGLLSLKIPHAAVVVLCVGIFVLVSGLFLPAVFLGFERGFKTFGKGVGFVLTWVLLVPFFYLVFAPGRLCMALSGKDPMHRKFPTDSSTSWWPYQAREGMAHYRKQYK